MGVLIWRGMVDVIGVADVSGALGVVGVCVSGRVYWGDRAACPAMKGDGAGVVCDTLVNVRVCVSAQCGGRYARVV